MKNGHLGWSIGKEIAKEAQIIEKQLDYGELRRGERHGEATFSGGEELSSKKGRNPGTKRTPCTSGLGGGEEKKRGR